MIWVGATHMIANACRCVKQEQPLFISFRNAALIRDRSSFWSWSYPTCRSSLSEYFLMQQGWQRAWRGGQGTLSQGAGYKHFEAGRCILATSLLPIVRITRDPLQYATFHRQMKALELCLICSTMQPHGNIHRKRLFGSTQRSQASEKGHVAMGQNPAPHPRRTRIVLVKTRIQLQSKLPSLEK